MYAGRTDEQKRRIADAVARALIAQAGASEASISVAIEDIAPTDWTEAVYWPDIAKKSGTIVRSLLRPPIVPWVRAGPAARC
jgi:4-oxalocrotonate tautomerase